MSREINNEPAWPSDWNNYRWPGLISSQDIIGRCDTNPGLPWSGQHFLRLCLFVNSHRILGWREGVQVVLPTVSWRIFSYIYTLQPDIQDEAISPWLCRCVSFMFCINKLQESFCRVEFYWLEDCEFQAMKCRVSSPLSCPDLEN